MSKYCVETDCSFNTTSYVEAKTEEEAIRLVKQDIMDNIRISDTNITDIGDIFFGEVNFIKKEN